MSRAIASATKAGFPVSEELAWKWLGINAARALGLDDPALTDEDLLDAMVEHPILINRPIVVTDRGAALCRPSEKVFELIAKPVASFTKEDGEVVSPGGQSA